MRQGQSAWNPRAMAAAAVVAWVAAAAAGRASPSQPPQRPPDIYYTPTRQAVAEAMLALAGVGPRDVVYDLGSGDGRLVILAAQLRGARGVGIEIQPALVARSRELAQEAEVEGRVRFVEGDLYTADIAEATVVTLYLSFGITREITPRLRRELAPGTRIVSQQFRLADWPPERSVVVEGAELFLWTVPPR
jgi:SAM-dependent methyltransferase